MPLRPLTRLAWLALALLAAAPAWAQAGGESLEQSICRLVDGAAKAQNLPVGLFTRLIWQESSFRPRATSPVGAQGIAQFMPGTARERGLADPFDPEQAIPAAASFLADLRRTFGNEGLAAAAYNGGPTRVATWLAGRGGLPEETRDYVIRITGRSAEEWAADRKGAPPPAAIAAAEEASCAATLVALRARPSGASVIAEGIRAPWGVQLSGNFSKALALAAFERSRATLRTVLGDVQPMVLGSRLRSRGTRSFYRVRVPAPTRTEANGLCARIRAAGGGCVVLKT